MLKRVLILLVFLGLAPAAQAALVLGPGAGPVELAGHLEVLQGAAAGADINAVASGRAGRFLPLTGQFVSGFSGYRDVWLRFTVASSGPDQDRWHLRILPPFLDHIDLYQPTDGGWQRSTGGDAPPFSARPLEDRAAAFVLDLPPGPPRTCYVHLRHEGVVNAYLTLYTPEQRQRVLTMEALAFGLYFGVVLVLLAINLLHWYTLRELIFIEFSAYLAIRGLYFLCYDGLAYQWLLRDSPEFLQDAIRFLLAWVVASLAPLLVRVLDMPRLYPRLARACYLLGGLAALFSITVWTGHFSRFGGVLSLIVLLLTAIGTVVAALQLRRDPRLGSLLLATMLILMAGLSVSALAGLGIHTSALADLYGGQIASFAVFFALHFAVAMRVLEIKQGQAASERAARLAAELAEQERAARREQSDFVAMLFHEIKTPLAEIASAATVLEHLDDGSRRETGTRYDTIHGAVERLNLLVEQNLARDRQGLEDIHLARRPVDPAALARVVLDSFGGTHRHRLSLAAPADLPHVDGDPEFLRVALANLVDNAIKYAPEGSEIRVEGWTGEGSVHMAVSDQGPGMDAAAMARAFDRYWRGTVAGNAGGAGLGLYLVRRIARAHGGEVAVASAPGRGSRFTLSIPVAAT